MKTAEMAQMKVIALSKAEISDISGGSRTGRKLFTLALFMACPAVGVFHLGVQEGYRNEAAKYQ